MKRYPLLSAVLCLSVIAQSGFTQPDLERPFRQIRPVIRFDRALIEGLGNYAIANDPAVLEHLNLTNEQKVKWKAIPDEVLAKNAKAIADYDAEQKAMDAKAAKETKEREDEIEVQLESVLGKHISVEQRQRLGQIELQSRMIDAFTDESVIKALSLKPEQIATAKAASETLKNNPSATLQKMIDVKKKAYDDFLKSLSEKQKNAWNELAGKPPGSIELASRDDTTNSMALPFVSPRLLFWFDSRNPLVASSSNLWTDELKIPRERVTVILRDIRSLRTQSRPSPLATMNRLNLPSQLMGNVTRDTRSQIDSLLTEAQKKRIQQVQLQLLGFRVFQNEKLLKDLNFTSTQEAALGRSIPEIVGKAIRIDRSRPVLSPAGPVGGSSAFDPIVMYDIQTAVLGVLDEQQRAVCEQYWGPRLKRDDWNRLYILTHKNPYISEPTLPVYDVDWSPAKAWNSIAIRCLTLGNHADARKSLEESLKLNPKQPDVQQKLVMLLAASPEDAVRDGKAAIKLATELCEGDGRKSPANLDALAAAQAEVGQFDEAVKTQQEVVALVKSQPLPPRGELPLRGTSRNRVQSQVLEFEVRLSEYKLKKPYRMEIRKR
jgi:tetratricopeptide (TPR) repeat protein